MFIHATKWKLRFLQHLDVSSVFNIHSGNLWSRQKMWADQRTSIVQLLNELVLNDIEFFYSLRINQTWYLWLNDLEVSSIWIPEILFENEAKLYKCFKFQRQSFVDFIQFYTRKFLLHKEILVHRYCKKPKW